MFGFCCEIDEWWLCVMVMLLRCDDGRCDGFG